MSPKTRTFTTITKNQKKNFLKLLELLSSDFDLDDLELDDFDFDDLEDLELEELLGAVFLSDILEKFKILDPAPWGYIIVEKTA